jgi:transposase
MPLYKHRYKRDGTIAFYGMRVPFQSQPEVTLSSGREATLVWNGNKVLIYQAIEVEERSPTPPREYLGVDLGLARIAVDSDGVTHPGNRHPFTPGQTPGTTTSPCPPAEKAPEER